MGPVDDSFQLLAAGYVRRQLRALGQQLPGARKAQDIECVHQARVASRRLRAALRMFRDCFPPKKVRRWRKAIRCVTGGLGSARDKDVQIEFVDGYLSALADLADRPGIERLLLRLRQQREALQPKVVKALKRLDDSGARRDMTATTKAVLTELESRDVPTRSPFVYLRAEQLILRRLEKLLTYQDCLLDPFDKPRHHEMRIVTKRLRYTMEICRPVYEEKLDEALVAARKLQDLLGDIHDCDVWIELLPQFMEQERVRTIVYYGTPEPLESLRVGIDRLQQERAGHRDETFLELGRVWRQLSEQGLWDALASMVLSHVHRPVQPAVPACQEPPAPAETESVPSPGVASPGRETPEPAEPTSPSEPVPAERPGETPAAGPRGE